VPFHGADESLALVSLEGTLASAILPFVDSSVSTTTIADSFIVPGNTGHGSHIIATEETLLLDSRIRCIPEVDVLDTTSSKLGRALLLGELDVVDLVRSTLV